MDVLFSLLAGSLRLLLKLLLIAMGLVFAASLFVVVLALGAGWGLRALWAKLLGRPVNPWVMRVNPRGAWQQFSRQPGLSSWTDVGRSVRRGSSDGAALHGAGDVIDVEVKERP